MNICSIQQWCNDFDPFRMSIDDHVFANQTIRIPIENTISVDMRDNIYKEMVKNAIHRRRTR